MGVNVQEKLYVKETKCFVFGWHNVIGLFNYKQLDHILCATTLHKYKNQYHHNKLMNRNNNE